MPVLEFKFTVPEGTIVRISGLDSVETKHDETRDPVERYFTEFLSNNGRKVFSAAARIEDFHGRPGFTFEDLAENLSISYESAKSMHRTAGRSAKRWRTETGTDDPIKFVEVDYVGFEHGERTVYRLPEAVVETIRGLPTFITDSD
jgi:hypothetical protein